MTTFPFLTILRNNPTIGLQYFTKSPKREMEFEIINPENLKTYTMKAEKLESKIIKIDGKAHKAIKIKWKLTGLMSLFYRTTAWFRVSDGVFLKSAVDDGEFHQLKEEE